MSEYTPNTEQIQDNYVEGMNAFYGERGASEYEEQFRRWLAAHDAEVRASVVAEEPQWEYGLEIPLHTGTTIVASDELAAKSQAWLYPMHRRREAGPWEAVTDA